MWYHNHEIDRQVVAILTGVALSGDVEIVALELWEPLEPVDEERVRVMSSLIHERIHSS